MSERGHAPDIPGVDAACYEDLVTAEDDDYEWPQFEENTASGLCYTSGTTGNPKGVLFSHRSTVLHAYAAALPDAKNYSAQSVVLPIVPMSTSTRGAFRIRPRSSARSWCCPAPRSTARASTP